MNKGKEKSMRYRRLWKGRKSHAITPDMLVRSLKTLHDSKLFGKYFSPVEVTHAVARKYPFVEQDPELLLKEVRDKLACAAAADIIGYKIDSGYHFLTPRGHCVRIDTKSELTFWLLYKRMQEAKSKSSKKKKGVKNYKVCNRRIK